MNLSERDRLWINQHKNLIGHIARVFFDNTTIVVVDHILLKYFINFIVETDEISNATCLPKEHVWEAMYVLQRNRLIRTVLS